MSFGDFCERLYEKIYETKIPKWQKEFLEECYRHKDIFQTPMRGDGHSTTKIIVRMLILEYDSLFKPLS